MENDLCWFCEKNPPSAGAALRKPVYRLVERRNAVVIKQIKYRVLSVDIPRCTNCARVHKKARRALWWPICIGAVLGFPGAAPGLIIVAGLGLLIGYYWQKRILKKNKTKPASNTVLSEHPALSGLIAEGWKLSKPG